MMNLLLIPLAIGLLALLFIPLLFRTVVSTNDVHIVQSTKETVSYGKGQETGNSYYAWPSWFPIIGIKTIVLPVSVFDIKLTDYAAYDKDRLPFMIDIIGFFRINNSNEAAERIDSFDALQEQLKGILQGAIRSILASSEISGILEGRAEFGQKFTQEVEAQLREWGVVPVKNIELMDIRDMNGSKVIADIMAMKKSEVESKSRMEIARNMQNAETAEIEAKQTVQLRDQEAKQLVNVRTAEQEQATFVAREKAAQNVADEKRITTEKSMEIQRVNDVRAAEIKKEVEVVNAEQMKQVSIVEAEGTKQQTVLIAEGTLEATKREAEGIQVVGNAKADAEKAMQMAPVFAQIELAKEIGANDGYQKYLVTIRTVEKDEKVGVEQASALKEAEIKIIANSGNAVSGLNNVMDVFTTTNGGTQLGAAVEAFAATEIGGKIMSQLTGNGKVA